MTPIMIRENDQIMMSLVHYFVTKENYAPIHVQGVKDEIWLENLEGPYRIIRINCNSIINEEQYNFDLLKMQQIIKQIKRKTMSFKVKTLNICLNLSNKIELVDYKDISTIKVENLDQVKKKQEIIDFFPNMPQDLIETNDGLELILNVTNDINEKTARENKKFAEVFSPKKIIFTKLIILVCIIMYFVVSFFGTNWGILTEFDADLLAQLGGSNILLVKSGELWRIITGAFLHVGLLHLLVNMYSLSIVGSQVETFIGKWKFILIYLISAISGSLMSLVFMKPYIVSVGASGAIFGLMGALLYFGYHYRLYLSSAIKNQIVPIIILNLVMGFIFMGAGVDNAAHIGGLIGGYLSAMALGIADKSKKKDMINGWIVLLLYVAFLSYVVFFLK